eukprot:760234-Hanusia_phi.AAC.5
MTPSVTRSPAPAAPRRAIRVSAASLCLGHCETRYGHRDRTRAGARAESPTRSHGASDPIIGRDPTSGSDSAYRMVTGGAVTGSCRTVRLRLSKRPGSTCHLTINPDRWSPGDYRTEYTVNYPAIPDPVTVTVVRSARPRGRSARPARRAAAPRDRRDNRSTGCCHGLRRPAGVRVTRAARPATVTTRAPGRRCQWGVPL